MVKTKEIKRTPDLRFSEFEGEWKQLDLGQIAKFRNGKAHEQEIEETGQFIVVNSKFISTEGHVKKYANRLICPLKKSEVVMVMSDIPRGKALAKCYYIEQGERYTLNQRICGLYSTNYSNKFLFYRLNRHSYFLKFDSGVGQTNLRKDEIKHCPLNIPESTIEQEKIASFLSAVDKKIQQLTARKELLEQYKKDVMQRIFSQEIRFTDDGGKDYPDWEEKKLGEITKIYDGTHTTPDYTKTGIPFYSVEHVTGGDFTKTNFIAESVFKKENKRVKLEKMDILMTRIGDIGTSVLLDWDVKASFYVSLALIKHSKLFNSSYLNQFIKSHHFQRDIFGKTIHAAFPKKINLGEIGKCLVFLPCDKEQGKIASFLSSIDKKIESAQTQLTQSQTFKKGLLQQMFV